MTVTTRTNSKGQQEVIADMVTPHLISAYKKAVRTEERHHENAAARNEAYENDLAEREIQAMADEIARRELEGNTEV